MSNSFNPEAVPDALKAAMILYQQANPTTSTGQPTVVQGIMNALNPQQQQQQQQQAAQPPSMGDVVGQAENAVPTQQQNAQMAAAQQMQGAAQGMPPGMEQQQMQQPDAGIVGLPASNTQQYKEGGVIGFAVGGMPEEATSEAGDFFSGIAGSIKDAHDRKVNEGLLRQQIVKATPSIFQALTPTERAARAAQVKELQAQLAKLTGDVATPTAATETKKPPDAPFPEVPPQNNDYAKLLAALGVSGGGGGSNGGTPDIDALTAQAEKTRDRLVQRPDTSPLEAIERMVNKHYAERPDIEGDALRRTEEDYAKEKEGRGMEAFLTRAAMMGRKGSSGLLDAHFEIKKRVAEADELNRKEVTLQRLAQQAVKDRNLGDLVGIKKALQEVNDAQAKMRSEGGINLLGGLLTSDTNSRNRAADAANASLSARAKTMAAMLRGKPSTAMGMGDIEKLNNMVQGAFKNPNSPVFQEYIGKLPNGKQLLIDLSKGNKKITDSDVAPKIALVMNMYRNDIIESSKHRGTQPVTFIGDYLNRADEEDADDTTEE